MLRKTLLLSQLKVSGTARLLLLLGHFQMYFLILCQYPSALLHQIAEQVRKKKIKENRNNLQIVLHVCILSFYHFVAGKENIRSILRRCMLRSQRGLRTSVPQLIQEMVQNLMFWTLKSSCGTYNPLFGTQAAHTVTYRRGKCLQIRC